MDTLKEKYGYPIYYSDFSCIADKCKNSCCIGWEIDVDEDTESFYEGLSGSYAEKIRESIVKDEDGAHFKLCENGNCPHLNEKGLCNIIKEYSEAALCDICSLHPRFKSFYTGYEETGLGLSCEEAARIIITSDEPFHIIAESGFDENLTNEEKEIIEVREDIFTALNYTGLKLSERLTYICREFGINIKKLNPEKLTEKLLSLERMDEEWTKVLTCAKSNKFSFDVLDSETLEGAFAKLAAYFIFRHFPKCLSDGDMESKVKFSVAGVLFLAFLLSGREDINLLIKYARMFSSEIEYSEDNTNKLYEIL